MTFARTDVRARDKSAWTAFDPEHQEAVETACLALRPRGLRRHDRSARRAFDLRLTEARSWDAERWSRAAGLFSTLVVNGVPEVALLRNVDPRIEALLARLEAPSFTFDDFSPAVVRGRAVLDLFEALEGSVAPPEDSGTPVEGGSALEVELDPLDVLARHGAPFILTELDPAWTGFFMESLETLGAFRALEATRALGNDPGA